MFASKNGNEQCAHALLVANADPNKANNNALTALMLSASGGHEQCVHALLEAGAQLEMMNNEKMTALAWASFNGHKSCVAMLVKAGARKEVQTKFGTVLSLAQRNGHLEICKLLT